jgi:hypothetical protein
LFLKIRELFIVLERDVSRELLVDDRIWDLRGFSVSWKYERRPSEGMLAFEDSVKIPKELVNTVPGHLENSFLRA